jgi:hypothetical protein
MPFTEGGVVATQLRKWLVIPVLGSLTGFAIVGAEAVYQRSLPSTTHLLVAIAMGVAAVAVSVALRSRLDRATP